MEGEVHFCTTSDGVRIAYRCEGRGYPLLMCPFFVETFSYDSGTSFFRQFESGVAASMMLVRYDLRGTGLSAHGNHDVSHQAVLLDLEAVALRSASGTPSSRVPPLVRAPSRTPRNTQSLWMR